MFEKIIQWICDNLYTFVLVAVLVVGGIYFTIRTKAVQVRTIKEQDSKYYSYNWVYSYATVDRNNIDAFNDGSGFIVGYILWKK